MTKNKTAIIITTFLREDLLIKSVQSILDNWNPNYHIFVGNQSYKTDNDKLQGFSNFGMNITDYGYGQLRDGITYYNLPFDCGLSYARNFLVKKAKEKGYEYCWISADSLLFTDKYDINNIIRFLDSNEKYGTIGFDINGRVPWEGDIELIPNKHFKLDCPKRPYLIFEGNMFQPVDIHRNFFIAKTKMLIDIKWDENLKLAEHIDWAYRVKNKNWKSFYNIDISGKYIEYKPKEYEKYRKRGLKKFKTLAKDKYNLKQLVVATRDMKKVFTNYWNCKMKKTNKRLRKVMGD